MCVGGEEGQWVSGEVDGLIARLITCPQITISLIKIPREVDGRMAALQSLITERKVCLEFSHFCNPITLIARRGKWCVDM